jgi:hypothetical protein
LGNLVALEMKTLERKTMLQRSVVMTAASLEIFVGAMLLAAYDIPCRLLFAATPEGVGIVLTRLAGIALVALGVACMPSTIAGSHRSALLGLLVFNLGAAILLVWVGVATPLHGLLLWPGAGLHAVIAAALLPQILTAR